MSQGCVFNPYIVYTICIVYIKNQAKHENFCEGVLYIYVFIYLRYGRFERGAILLIKELSLFNKSYTIRVRVFICFSITPCLYWIQYIDIYKPYMMFVAFFFIDLKAADKYLLIVSIIYITFIHTHFIM